MLSEKEEVQTTTEIKETPEIKAKTVEDVKKAVEEAEQVAVINEHVHYT